MEQTAPEIDDEDTEFRRQLGRCRRWLVVWRSGVQPDVDNPKLACDDARPDAPPAIELFRAVQPHIAAGRTVVAFRAEIRREQFARTATRMGWQAAPVPGLMPARYGDPAEQLRAMPALGHA